MFNPMAFVDNLYYMGFGMLSIFIVIGLIMLSTVILNKVTAKKDDDMEDDD
ncbi:MAG: hypothetical protein Q8882_04585 [Bacillota bacterium]|nr:hypothetical protein [Bacillota bacterium]